MHNAAYNEEEQPSFKQHLTPGSRHRKISEGKPPEEGGDALSVASGSDVASEYTPLLSWQPMLVVVSTRTCEQNFFCFPVVSPEITIVHDLNCKRSFVLHCELKTRAI